MLLVTVSVTFEITDDSAQQSKQNLIANWVYRINTLSSNKNDMLQINRQNKAIKSGLGPTFLPFIWTTLMNS